MRYDAGRKKDMCFKREKRYLLLMPEYVMGGAETQFRYLIDYAEKVNWKLDVIIEHRYQQEDSLLKQDMARMKQVRFYEMQGSGNSDERILQFIAGHILKNILRIKYEACLIQYAPDIVMAPTLRFLGLDVIYSERVDAVDVLRTGQREKCLRYCNILLANSVYAKEKLQKLTGRKVGLIRNGKPVVERLPMKKSRKISRILVPGRIVPHKNQLLLLRYLQEYPSFDGKIVFAGLVEDRAYQRKLHGFVNKNHLHERVEFLGYVQDMRAEYDKADLVILPSFAEGTPNVVLEAYAYGRPVIVSDIETERDVVRNPKLRFTANSVDAVAGCINYIQNLTEQEYMQLLDNNREYVLRNYNVNRMVRKFHKVLTQKEGA